MKYSEKQTKIYNKATKKQVKNIIKQAKANEKNLTEQMMHIVKKTFTDVTYNKAISNVTIIEQGLDIGCLRDTLQDYELNNMSSVLVYTKITFNNGVKADIQAWVTIEDDMKIIKGDFRIASIDYEIDHDGLQPTKNTFVADCLDTLQQIEDNQ